MASEYKLNTAGQITPEDKGGPRVGVMGKAIASRDSAGAICIQLRRGDGGGPETFGHTVRTIWLGPFLAGEPADLRMGAMDLDLDNFDPRSYQLRIVADGGATLTVKAGSAFVATEPFAPAGTGP